MSRSSVNKNCIRFLPDTYPPAGKHIPVSGRISCASTQINFAEPEPPKPEPLRFQKLVTLNYINIFYSSILTRFNDLKLFIRYRY